MGNRNADDARPLMRAALYARYSTDNQNERSIDDQLASCRRLAERLGAHVVREFADAGISGQAMANRPEVRQLMQLVEAGGCDLVIAEHTNRLSRDGEQGWGIFNRLRLFDVRYVTVEEGEVNITLQGVSSLVSEQKIEETRHKTRRGMGGQFERGFNVTEPPYAYRVRIAHDDRGDRIAGLIEIDPGKVPVVERIFREWAAGVSAQGIADRLNADLIPAPRGGRWIGTTIRHSAEKGRGILHNDIYRGVRVWGRNATRKDRRTGRRVDRPQADPDKILRRSFPELRIISDELWAAAQARAPMPTVPGPRRPRAFDRLLQGLVVCAGCGGPMNFAGPRDYLRCANRAQRLGCENARTPRYDQIEPRVIDALRSNLLHPEVVEHAIRKIQEGLRAANRDAGQRRAKLAAELAELRRRMAGLIDQMEGGAPWSAIAERHGDLEARTAAIQDELATAPSAEVVELHPNAARLYREHVARLHEALQHPQTIEDREQRQALRALIHAVEFTPRPGKNQYDLEIVGNLAPLFSETVATAPLRGGANRLKLCEAWSGEPTGRGDISPNLPFRQVA